MGNQVKLIAAGVAVAEALPSARRGHRKRSLARAADGAPAGIAVAGAFEVFTPTVVIDDLRAALLVAALGVMELLKIGPTCWFPPDASMTMTAEFEERCRWSHD